VYFPQLIAPRLLATLVVRTTGDPMMLATPIRQVIKGSIRTSRSAARCR
jgi:hypothetical protein